MLLKLHCKLRRPDCQVLINRIAEICYNYYIRFYVDHIAGKNNIAVDALSRYLPSPCAAAPFPVSTPINTMADLQKASDLAKYIEVDPKMLSWKDEDTQ